MAGKEGTIRFAYALESPEGPIAAPRMLAAIAGWRSVFKRLGMLGQDPARYGGLGFGNLSGRDSEQPAEFVITASQTAAAPSIADGDLVRIANANPARFWVDACGRHPPSSETLTHAMVYQADPSVGWVFHVHSPDIWRQAETLALPATAGDVPYGSRAMVEAVSRLLSEHRARPLVFASLGHEDGVFACGDSADAAGGALVSLLARSLP